MVVTYYFDLGVLAAIAGIENSSSNYLSIIIQKIVMTAE